MGRMDDPALKWAIDLVNYADPDETGLHMTLAEDLMIDRANRASLEAAADRLAILRDDETISNGEIKGLLNRASGKTWGTEYAQRFEPRAFIAELERAVRDYLRRRPDLR